MLTFQHLEARRFLVSVSIYLLLKVLILLCFQKNTKGLSPFLHQFIFFTLENPCVYSTFRVFKNWWCIGENLLYITTFLFISLPWVVFLKLPNCFSSKHNSDYYNNNFTEIAYILITSSYKLWKNINQGMRHYTYPKVICFHI